MYYVNCNAMEIAANFANITVRWRADIITPRYTHINLDTDDDLTLVNIIKKNVKVHKAISSMSLVAPYRENGGR